MLDTDHKKIQSIYAHRNKHESVFDANINNNKFVNNKLMTV